MLECTKSTNLFILLKFIFLTAFAWACASEFANPRLWLFLCRKCLWFAFFAQK